MNVGSFELSFENWQRTGQQESSIEKKLIGTSLKKSSKSSFKWAWSRKRGALGHERGLGRQRKVNSTVRNWPKSGKNPEPKDLLPKNFRRISSSPFASDQLFACFATVCQIFADPSDQTSRASDLSQDLAAQLHPSWKAWFSLQVTNHW